MIDCVTGFRCVLCGAEQPAGFTGYTCPDCGPEGILDIQYDYEKARRSVRRANLARDLRHHIWRYEALLPAPPPEIWPDEPQAIVTGETAMVLCIERVGGAELMASNTFVRENGVWRIMSHQAEPLPAERAT